MANTKRSQRESCAQWARLLRDRWYELMQDYSDRSSTKENDKLPVLSSLASQFKEQFSTRQYLAGLWSNHLPSALLWRTLHRPPLIRSYIDERLQPRRPTLYIAPSWSWASIHGAITHERQRLTSASKDIPEMPEESAANYDFRVINVDSTHVQLKGAGPFGEISNPSLVLRARVVPVNPMNRKLSGM